MKVTRGGFLLVVVFATGIALAEVQSGQKPAGGPSPVGDWRGDSLCQVRPSACHDEDSLYHFTKVAGKAGAYSLKADKIVNGQAETMGILDCSYDAKAQALECVIPDRAVLRFTWEDTVMKGTMTLTDKTLWRKLTLKKVGPKT